MLMQYPAMMKAGTPAALAAMDSLAMVLLDG